MITHSSIEVNGARLHVARTGRGRPLLLLHGWPEFWLTWEPVMVRLADRFELIAPDLRGFGDSDKPAGDHGPAAHALDIAALIEAMGLAPAGIVSHDVGASVAQGLGRTKPELVCGLFFFNLFYPGIGARYTTPEHLRFVWHTYFNQSEIAPALLRGSSDGIRLFIEHFVKLWAYRKEAVEDLITALAANMAKPGNLEGGFAYYRGAAEEREAAAARGEAEPPITLPTCVRWTERDTALDIAWADRLPEFFSDLDFAPFANAGHFPHHEQPERAAAEIAGFFDRLADRR